MHHAHGSGTLNINDKNIEKYCTQKLIEKSMISQITLLKKAITILKSGGTMVYSTCSILKEENEEILEKALKGTKAKILPIEFNRQRRTTTASNKGRWNHLCNANRKLRRFFCSENSKINQFFRLQLAGYFIASELFLKRKCYSSVRNLKM